MKYYTYAYLREDGTPYYVGKGKGFRIHSNQRTLNLPPKERRIYLKQNLTEEEAFKHEIYMIDVLGRKDLGTGLLRNMTDGGEGTTNLNRESPSEETREKMRKAKIGRTLSEEHKRNISESCKKNEFSEEHRRKISESKKGKKRSPVSEETREKLRQSALKQWREGRGHTK